MSCLLSVLIPAYNEESYIDSCVDSVGAALYGRNDAEIIIADDGSTDKTRAIAEKLATRDRRITVLKSHKDGINVGEWKTRNLCVERAKGKYISFVDADDIVDRRRYETCLSLLEQNPEIDGVLEAVGVFFEDEAATQQWGERTEVFSHDPSIPSDGFLAATFDGRCRMLTPGLTARRTLFQKAGFYGTKRTCSEDFHMWLRMAACGKFVVGDNATPLVMYRRHAGNTWIPHRHDSFRDLSVVAEVLAWAKKNPAVPKKNRCVLEGALKNKLFHCLQLAIDESLTIQGFKAIAVAAYCMPGLLSHRRIWTNMARLTIKRQSNVS